MVDSLITLYEQDEIEFKTNGLGSLIDAASCSVYEERNGEFDLTMEYPVTGRHFSDLTMRRIIFAPPNPYSPAQPFRIYEISKPINGIVSIFAHHISYDLDGYPIAPFDTSSLLDTFEEMNRQMTQPWNSGHHAFHFSTTKTGAADTFSLVAPCSARALLGGSEGTVLDRWPGEYEWDKWEVKYHQNRGADRGVTIEYGKNLTDLEQEENCENCWTDVYPYFYTEPQTDDEGVTTGGLVELDEKTLACPGTHNYRRVFVLDLTSEFEEQPTKQQLKERAQKYIEENELGSPKVSLTVSFISLSDTTAYSKLKLLEEVRLCDTVHVYFPLLNVASTSTCISTTYNVLSGKYTEIELGEAKSNLAATIVDRTNSTNQKIESAVNSSTSYLEGAIKRQSQLITGNAGGYVVLHDTNSDGMPDELLVLDAENLSDAKNVWRWNLTGLGHSSTGYTGDYTTGWTMDGHFNASLITVGELMANLIKVGILSDKNGYNYWNMETGEFRMAATVTVDGQTIPSIAEGKANNALEDAKDYTDTFVSDFVQGTYEPAIAELQKQLDGQIETYYYDYAPTLQNEPASLWKDDTEKARHEGDLFYWKAKGYAYRFFKDGNTWKWQLVQDTDITQALQKAQDAKDTADNKRRVFVAQPTPPYDIGDLWVEGPKGDIFRCQRNKTSGAFSKDDWILASKYTDDSAFLTFVEGDYAETIEDLKTQDDQKSETWYQNADPSTAWGDTTTKNNHKGDMWYCTSASDTTHYGKYWMWNGATWVEMKTEPPQEVMDTLDGKAQIFIDTPKPPYHEGDLWFQSNTSDIMTCIKDRESGSYLASEWEKRNKYIDLYSVDVGGTNMLANTQTFEGADYYDGTKVTRYVWDNDFFDSSVILECDCSSLSTSEKMGGFEFNGLEPDTDYTFSVYVYSPSSKPGTFYPFIQSKSGMQISVVSSSVNMNGDTSTNANGIIEAPIPTSWTRYWVTWHTTSSVKNSNQYIVVCAQVTAGSYAMICAPKLEKGNRATDWSPAPKDAEVYTNKAIDSQTQESIFNKLTNNGTIQGLYMEGGQLYLLFTYAKGGTLSLGGKNNGYGTIKIYDNSGSKTGEWTNEGLTAAGTFTSQYRQPNGVVSDIAELNAASLSFSEPNTDAVATINGFWGEFGISSSGIIRVYTYDKEIMILDGRDSINCVYVYSKLWVEDGISQLALSINYDQRSLNAYSMSSNISGDIGSGVIGNDGKCYVEINDIFSESVNTSIEYYVFLQKEGPGDLWVSEKEVAYFVVEGTPGLHFSWEIKAKIKGSEGEYLTPVVTLNDILDVSDHTSSYEKDQQNIADDFYKIDEMYEADYLNLFTERGGVIE